VQDERHAVPLEGAHDDIAHHARAAADGAGRGGVGVDLDRTLGDRIRNPLGAVGGNDRALQEAREQDAALEAAGGADAADGDIEAVVEARAVARDLDRHDDERDRLHLGQALEVRADVAEVRQELGERLPGHGRVLQAVARLVEAVDEADADEAVALESTETDILLQLARMGLGGGDERHQREEDGEQHADENGARCGRRARRIRATDEPLRGLGVLGFGKGCCVHA